jgi:hypothetical protein
MGVVKKVVKALAPAAAWAMLAAGTSGCAILHARSRSLGPPLDMPSPPARVVPIASQPIVVEAPSTVDDVPKQAPSTIDASTPPQAPARAEPSPPTRPETPADASATPAAPPPAPTPPPVLQTTANPTVAEQRTRTVLESAKRDLGRIDLKRLNSEARSQYDIARRFVQQAEEALRARNPLFAEQLADKAATLAALLQKQ